LGYILLLRNVRLLSDLTEEGGSGSRSLRLESLLLELLWRILRRLLIGSRLKRLLLLTSWLRQWLVDLWS
jgi:hypothetical protein